MDRRGSGDGMYKGERVRNRGSLSGLGGSTFNKLNAGDGGFGTRQVADGLVVPMMLGNADGGKEPWFTGVY